MSLCPGKLSICPNKVWSGLQHLGTYRYVGGPFLIGLRRRRAVCSMFGVFNRRLPQGAWFVATGNLSPLDEQQLADRNSVGRLVKVSSWTTASKTMSVSIHSFPHVEFAHTTNVKSLACRLKVFGFVTKTKEFVSQYTGELPKQCVMWSKTHGVLTSEY